MVNRVDSHLDRLRGRGLDWPICWDAVELIARSEDCRTGAYQCSAGVWTIGWGETEGIQPGMRWTADQCDARFHQQLRRYAAQLEAMLTRPADEYELGAMVSLAYNVGLGDPADTRNRRGFYWSSVRRLHNSGDSAGAARAFHLFDKARDPSTGKLVRSRGLAARRAREAALYLRPVADTPAEPMPQAVAPESALTSSPIAQGGAATAGLGIVTAAASAVGDQVQQAAGVLATIKAAASQVADFVGLPPGLLLGAALALVGWRVWHWRRQQRAEGWA